MIFVLTDLGKKPIILVSSSSETWINETAMNFRPSMDD